MFSRLIELGMTPRKSLTIKFPKTPNHLLCHFIRGYFNGDGCADFRQRVRKDRKNKVYSSIMFMLTCGSKEFLSSTREILKSTLNIGQGSLFFHYGAYNLAYSTRDVIKLYSFIYPTSEVPCLKRKQQILEAGLKALGP